eukprot:4527535-Prymnesium_polylepis.1
MPGAARQAAEGQAEERGAQLRGGGGQLLAEMGVREVGRDPSQGVLEQDCQGASAQPETKEDDTRAEQLVAMTEKVYERKHVYSANGCSGAAVTDAAKAVAEAAAVAVAEGMVAAPMAVEVPWAAGSPCATPSTPSAIWA